MLLALLLACGVVGDADGDGFTAGEGDCDDHAADRHPGAAETCDGVDQDCNGQVDDAVMTDLYTDADGDGWGDDVPIIACAGTEGLAAASGDCDDADPSVHPSAGEVCNGRDDDCDRGVDEEATDAQTWYLDGDGDGYGDTEVVDCEARAGYAADGGDCLDEGTRDGLAAEDVNPGAPELCNGLDDNCDGVADDGVDADTCIGGAASRFTTTRAATGLGRGLVGLDVDGDGAEEVALGAASEGCGSECGGEVFLCVALPGEQDVDDCRASFAPSGADGQLGTALAAGDVDGDGADDLVVSAPTADCGATNRGAVYVWYGGALAVAGQGEGLSDAATVCGDASRTQWDDAWVTAVDADAAEDLVLADAYGSGVAVYVVGGGEDLPAALTDPAERVRLTLEGGAVATSGADLDGDGYGEVAVGGNNNGKVFVCSGARLAESGSLAGDFVAPVECAVTTGSTGFGASLVLAPDLDGDGLGELVGGEPSWDATRADVGRFVFWGGAGLVDGSGGTAWGELRGDTESGQIGADAPAIAVRGAEVRLAVGQPNVTTTSYLEGTVWVAVGVPGPSTLLSDVAVARVGGLVYTGQLGAAVAFADVGGDGAPDLIVGAPSGSTGTAYVLDGAGW